MYFWCGSSPRVRGTVRLRPVRHGERRFIPACAGNRNANNRWEGQVSVHPRVCGEQPAASERSLSDVGSSPRVRGTALDDDRLAGVNRFIPACAGNSRTGSSRCISGAVHPRVCGEQCGFGQYATANVGSSPRVRGTGTLQSRQEVTGRFIPACAGNSRWISWGTPNGSVHPRVCGEQVCPYSLHAGMPGSSPRVRGTESFPAVDLKPGRFIPACAGNSDRV